MGLTRGASIDSLDQILTNKFRLSSFRLGQREIIESVIKGKDVMAVMPTGGGKSLCYQLPAYRQAGITIVVSPLIALMNDQVHALKALNLPAGCIHSGLDIDQRKAVFRAMELSQSFVLFLSPERIQKPGFAQWIKNQKINLFAIDEAHCVSQWGHDFRPDYALLKILRQLRPEVPMMGLTATATPQVKRDIANQLGLKNPEQHVYGFYRPNLYYQVEFCEDDSEKEDFVLQAIGQTPVGRVIVYCGTRNKAEEWAGLIAKSSSAADHSVAFYHAGLGTERRTEIEREYQRGTIRILAATNAFGMGIDHPDVRLVVHTQMPGNIESYYQEIGRAGRDGKNSTCLLVYSKKDKGLQSYFIQQSDADPQHIRHRWQSLDAIVQYSEGSECRHADILTYFRDQKRITQCGHCDTCDPKSTRRILKPVRVFAPKTKLKKKKKAEVLDPIPNSPDQNWRSELIRQWRKDYAKENDIPAFMVFSDRTLVDLVRRLPTNETDLLKVYGMGEKKVEAFGKALLEELHAEIIKAKGHDS